MEAKEAELQEIYESREGHCLLSRHFGAQRVILANLQATSPPGSSQFAYIAGYTEGGFPYGITWEEHWASQEWQDDEPGDLGDIFSDDLMNKGDVPQSLHSVQSAGLSE